jgi:hypothetical protein
VVGHPVPGLDGDHRLGGGEFEVITRELLIGIVIGLALYWAFMHFMKPKAG